MIRHFKGEKMGEVYYATRGIKKTNQRAHTEPADYIDINGSETY